MWCLNRLVFLWLLISTIIFTSGSERGEVWSIISTAQTDQSSRENHKPPNVWPAALVLSPIIPQSWLNSHRFWERIRKSVLIRLYLLWSLPVSLETPWQPKCTQQKLKSTTPASSPYLHTHPHSLKSPCFLNPFRRIILSTTNTVWSSRKY